MPSSNLCRRLRYRDKCCGVSRADMCQLVPDGSILGSYILPRGKHVALLDTTGGGIPPMKKQMKRVSPRLTARVQRVDFREITQDQVDCRSP